jgi:outer membrane cobalamin receptor
LLYNLKKTKFLMKKILFGCALTYFLFSLDSGILFSQTAGPLEQSITVTAQADPVAFENLSRTVSVITRQEISRMPAHSVPELLQFISSIDVRSRGVMGVQSDFSIRGAGYGQCLILINGIRLNDSQTGHHNADIPVPMDEIERIEVLQGAGSSLYGADAFGGTINIITRTDSRGLHGKVLAGGFGLFEGTLAGGLQKGILSQTLAFNFDQSSGFSTDRDFRTFNFSSQTAWGEKTRFLFGYLNKEFGALGFYGDSPSREWTNQTLVSLDQKIFHFPGWDLEGELSFRTHGDRFLWDQNYPGLFENRHRTYAGSGQLRLHRDFSKSTHLVMGIGSGVESVYSSNLGDHSYSSWNALAELQQKLGSRGMLSAGLRFDQYSRFGNAMSPSLSGSWWLFSRLKARAAFGHAFRVPSFTELYYHDPNNQGRPDLQPESGWEGEGGADWLIGQDWLASCTLFARNEENVIDWIRHNPHQKWMTANIRRVHFRGVEIGVQRHIGSAGRVQLQYTLLNANAGAIDYISKYVLDYARHSLAETWNMKFPKDYTLGQQLSYRLRLDGRRYWLLDARLSKKIQNHLVLFLEGTNLLNSRYQEILGVSMPGCWIKGGLEFRLF